MARSSNEVAASRRAEIVAVGARLFCERGIAAVSINEIMQAAGLTHGGFYNHFASKEQLAAEACCFAFEQFSSYRIKPFEELLDAIGESSCPVICFAHEAAEHRDSSEFREAYAAGVARLFSIFATAATSRFPKATDAAIRISFGALAGAAILGTAAGREGYLRATRLSVLKALWEFGDHTYV